MKVVTMHSRHRYDSRPTIRRKLPPGDHPSGKGRGAVRPHFFKTSGTKPGPCNGIKRRYKKTRSSTLKADLSDHRSELVQRGESDPISILESTQTQTEGGVNSVSAERSRFCQGCKTRTANRAQAKSRRWRASRPESSDLDPVHTSYTKPIPAPRSLRTDRAGRTTSRAPPQQLFAKSRLIAIVPLAIKENRSPSRATRVKADRPKGI